MKEEIDRLKLEITSLEEIKTSHQGFKLLWTMSTKEMFEDAVQELWEKQFEKKFQGEKEKMIGKGPWTV